MTAIAYIGLGSNLGDRPAILKGAIAALNATPGVVVRAVSSLQETEPVGGPPGQGRYLNAAVALETTLEPLELLRVLQEIEQQFGRVRTVRFGERTLDLDLLLFGNQVISAPGLNVPHPRFAHRHFVLVPLAEIAPGAVDPRSGRTVAELLANLGQRGTDPDP
jgi:2-amino-4-hydroxy-6-hydroxymethyldihydropteridine diphosphokinase